MDWWNGPYTDRRIISRPEALMRPAPSGRRSRRGSAATTTLMQAAELADVLTGRKGTALEASEGCSVAAAALAADDDEMIRDSVMAHAHDGCGWSFPDEPEPGH